MKQAVNSFTGGLQMDTHPLQLNANTLTDALNATIITMNGDENILLNDMGNRRVDQAYLPAGYMPIGIKEYGGIIYIASYNPITGRGLVGSFPSPEQKAKSHGVNGEGYNGNLTNFAETESYNWVSGFLKNKLTIVKLTNDSLRTGDKFTIYCPEFWENSFGEKYLNNFNSNISTITQVEGIVASQDNLPSNVPEGTLYAVGTLSDGEYIRTKPNLYRKTNSNWEPVPKEGYYEINGSIYYSHIESLKWKYTPVNLNRLFTLSVGVLDNLNNFIDITKSLARWNKNVLLDTKGLSEEERFNTGYFIASGVPDGINDLSIDDANFLKDRLAFPINTYAYKTAGPLFLKTTLNTISSFNYDLDVQVDSNYNVTFIVNAEIEADCPLGISNVSVPAKGKQISSTIREATIVINQLPLTAPEGSIYIVTDYYEGNSKFKSSAFKVALRVENNWVYSEDTIEAFKVNKIPAQFYDCSTELAEGFISPEQELPSTGYLGDVLLLRNNNLIYKYINSNWELQTVPDTSIYKIENVGWILCYSQGTYTWEQISLTPNLEDGGIFLPSNRNSPSCGYYSYSNGALHSWTLGTNEIFTITAGDSEYVIKYENSEWSYSEWPDNKVMEWSDGIYNFKDNAKIPYRIITPKTNSDIKLPLFDIKILRANGNIETRQANSSSPTLIISNIEQNGNIYKYKATCQFNVLKEEFNYAILPKTAPLTFSNDEELYLKDFSVFGNIDPVEIHDEVFKITLWNYFYNNNILKIKGAVSSWSLTDSMKFVFTRGGDFYEHIIEGTNINFELSEINFFQPARIYQVEIFYMKNELWETLGSNWWVMTASVLNEFQENNSVSDICALYTSYKNAEQTLSPLQEALKEALTITPRIKPNSSEKVTLNNFNSLVPFRYSIDNSPFYLRKEYIVTDNTEFQPSIEWDKYKYPTDEFTLTEGTITQTNTLINENKIKDKLSFDNSFDIDGRQNEIENAIEVNERTYTIPYETFWGSLKTTKNVIKYLLFSKVLCDAIDSLQKPWFAYPISNTLLVSLNNTSDDLDIGTDLHEYDWDKADVGFSNIWWSDATTATPTPLELVINDKGGGHFCIAGTTPAAFGFKLCEHLYDDDMIMRDPDWNIEGKKSYTSLANHISIIWIKLNGHYGVLYMESVPFDLDDNNLESLKANSKAFLEGSLKNVCYGFNNINYRDSSDYDTPFKYGDPSNRIDYYYTFNKNLSEIEVYTINENEENSTKYDIKDLANEYEFSCEISLQQSDNNLVQFILKDSLNDPVTIKTTENIYPFKLFYTFEYRYTDALNNFIGKDLEYVIEDKEGIIYLTDIYGNPIQANCIYDSDQIRCYFGNMEEYSTGTRIPGKIDNVYLPVVNGHVYGFEPSPLRLTSKQEIVDLLDEPILNKNYIPLQLPYLLKKVTRYGNAVLDMACDKLICE